MQGLLRHHYSLRLLLILRGGHGKGTNRRLNWWEHLLFLICRRGQSQNLTGRCHRRHRLHSIHIVLCCVVYAWVPIEVWRCIWCIYLEVKLICRCYRVVSKNLLLDYGILANWGAAQWAQQRRVVVFEVLDEVLVALFVELVRFVANKLHDVVAGFHVHVT